MAIDLTSLVSDYLTPQLVNQIATAAGVNPATAQNLVDGAVPAVVGALSNVASAPAGAKKIMDAVSNADPDLLTKLSSSLAAGKSDAATAGANALGGILGGSTLWSLAGAIGQFAGVPQGAAQTTVGAISQALFGVLGQQDPSSWSDPAAVASLFSSQKDIVNAALPPGLATLLSSSGLLSGVGAAASGAMSSMRGAASSTASSAANAASSAMNQARAPAPSGGMPMWLMIVIAVVVVAAIVLYFSTRTATKPATTGAAGIELALAAAQLPFEAA